MYDPMITDDMVEFRQVAGLWVGQIDVGPDDIKEIKSCGSVTFARRDGPQVNYTFVCINVTFLKLGRCLPRLSLKGPEYVI